LSLFDELRRREAAYAAILYAFDLIERAGEDMRNCPFLDRKAALARLLRDTEAGILFNEHIAEDIVFAHACRLGAEGIVSKKVGGTYQSAPCRVWINVRNPASPCSGRGVSFGTHDPEAAAVGPVHHIKFFKFVPVSYRARKAAAGPAASDSTSTCIMCVPLKISVYQQLSSRAVRAQRPILDASIEMVIRYFA
jgi:hypothetical protein